MSADSAGRRLNFGCGYDKRPGYVNVDMDPRCEPDVLLPDNDLRHLGREAFVEVLAKDVLEHIPRLQTPDILLEWNELLVAGGQLRVQTSSIEGVAAQIKATPSFREHYNWTHCLFGTQAQEGDFHLTGFTNTSLTVYLLAAGYRVDRIWITDKWLLNAEATKIASWTAGADDPSTDDETFVRTTYRDALEREPAAHELAHLTGELAAGRLDRRAVAKHVWSSPERLFIVADRHGYEPAPPRITAAAVAARTPESWKPALRSLRSALRSANGRGRRALGAVRARPARS